MYQKDEEKTIPYERALLPGHQAVTVADFSFQNGHMQMNFKFYLIKIGNFSQKFP